MERSDIPIYRDLQTFKLLTTYYQLPTLNYLLPSSLNNSPPLLFQYNTGTDNKTAQAKDD